MIHKTLQKDVQCRPSENVMGEAYRLKLAADTAAFEAKGGTVKIVPPDATAYPFRMRTREDALADEKRRFKINVREDD